MIAAPAFGPRSLGLGRRSDSPDHALEERIARRVERIALLRHPVPDVLQHPLGLCQTGVEGREHRLGLADDFQLVGREHPPRVLCAPFQRCPIDAGRSDEFSLRRRPIQLVPKRGEPLFGPLDHGQSLPQPPFPLLSHAVLLGNLLRRAAGEGNIIQPDIERIVVVVGQDREFQKDHPVQIAVAEPIVGGPELIEVQADRSPAGEIQFHSLPRVDVIERLAIADGRRAEVYLQFVPTRIAVDAKHDVDHARRRMRLEVPRDPGKTVWPERSPQTHRGPALLLDDRDVRIVLMFPFGQRPVAEIPMDAEKRSRGLFDFAIGRAGLPGGIRGFGCMRMDQEPNANRW